MFLLHVEPLRLKTIFSTSCLYSMTMLWTQTQALHINTLLAKKQKFMMNKLKKILFPTLKKYYEQMKHSMKNGNGYLEKKTSRMTL
jgi:hypothetical protein